MSQKLEDKESLEIQHVEKMKGLNAREQAIRTQLESAKMELETTKENVQRKLDDIKKGQEVVMRDYQERQPKLVEEKDKVFWKNDYDSKMQSYGLQKNNANQELKNANEKVMTLETSLKNIEQEKERIELPRSPSVQRRPSSPSVSMAIDDEKERKEFMDLDSPNRARGDTLARISLVQDQTVRLSTANEIAPSPKANQISAKDRRHTTTPYYDKYSSGVTAAFARALRPKEKEAAPTARRHTR